MNMLRCCLCLALAPLAPLAFCQQASISGTVIDSTGAIVPGARVKLSLAGRAADREAQAAAHGDFMFSDVLPGAYRLVVNAQGFDEKIVTAELPADANVNLAPIALTVASVSTDLEVTADQSKIAEAQIKEAEKQKFVGLVPNYFANYNPDAAPLNMRQKFQLTWKTFLDPSSFVITGVVAGVAQARDIHKGFGQGIEGYAKRYGSSYADFVTGSMIGGVIAPTIFKQDPRYFYKGTGTTSARFFYAISRSLICKGDNKKNQFCYSSFTSRFASGFASNYYYPRADRNSTSYIIQSGFIGIGADAAGNLFQEFFARKLMWKKH